MKLAGAILPTFLLTGCFLNGEVVPPPAEGDCYHTNRMVNISPVMGASTVLEGRLVKSGCTELIKAITEAKKAGVDVNLNRLLGY